MQAVELENEAIGELRLGCSKCRYAQSGCARCRNPSFRPRKGAVPREELAALAQQQRREARRGSTGERLVDTRPVKRSRGSVPTASAAAAGVQAHARVSTGGGVVSSLVGQLRRHLTQSGPEPGSQEGDSRTGSAHGTPGEEGVRGDGAIPQGVAQELEGLHPWQAQHTAPAPAGPEPDELAADAAAGGRVAPAPAPPPAAAQGAWGSTGAGPGGGVHPPPGSHPAMPAGCFPKVSVPDPPRQPWREGTVPEPPPPPAPPGSMQWGSVRGDGGGGVQGEGGGPEAVLAGVKRQAGAAGAAGEGVEEGEGGLPRVLRRPAKMQRVGGGKALAAGPQRSKRPRSLGGERALAEHAAPCRYRKVLPEGEQDDVAQPMDVDGEGEGREGQQASDDPPAPASQEAGGAGGVLDSSTGSQLPGGFLSQLEATMEKRRAERRESGAGIAAASPLRQRLEPSKPSKRQKMAVPPSPGDATAAEPDPRLCLWEPPASPFGLIEEELYDDPWKLLVACMLLNKTSGQQVRKVIWSLFELCPTPASAVAADTAAIEALIQPLGLYRKRAVALQRLSREYLEKQWREPQELHGIGQYAADAYHIFCRGRWREVAPQDKDLLRYLRWLESTGGEGSGLSRHRTVSGIGIGGQHGQRA